MTAWTTRSRTATATTREAAERLGVKPETVYAYVSRGQLEQPTRAGRPGQHLRRREVDALARRGSRREPPRGRPERRARAFRTGITLIDTDRYYFRGVDAVELAAALRLRGGRRVAVDRGAARAASRFTAPAEPPRAARRAVDALPAHSGAMDRLRVAAVAAAAADPLRFDLAPRRVLGCGPRR